MEPFRIVALLALAALSACADCDGNPAGTGDGDADAATDAGPDADADGDTDGGGDGDADGDESTVPDTAWIPTCGDGEEVCGNCCDEDGDDEDEACPLDDVYLTPRLLPPGGTLSARACTRADPAYSCVDLRCALGDRAADGHMVDSEYRMGLTCWEFEVLLPEVGTWSCFLLRLGRAEEGCSDEAGVDLRACGVVEVRE